MTILTQALNGLANHACLLSPAGNGRISVSESWLGAHRGASRIIAANGVSANVQWGPPDVALKQRGMCHVGA